MDGDFDTVTLYKKDRKGKMRFWSIEADEYEILMEHGTVDGEAQEVYEYIDEGKAGRTQHEQLLLKINSKIKRRLDKGYVNSIDKAENEPVTNSLGLKMHMRAHKYRDVKKPIDLSEWILQYKYNGHRCAIHNNGERLIAYSRNGKEIHTIWEILEAMQGNIPVGGTVDGELFKWGVKLQTIGSWIKKRQTETATLDFVMYDYMDPSGYHIRYKMLKEIAEKSKDHRVVVAPNLLRVLNHSELMERLDYAIDVEKYEGLMLRNPEFGYENCVSRSLLKVKRFDDAEFIVVDIIPSKDDWAILVCLTDEGKHFTVSCPGTVPFKEQVFRNSKKYIGATVNVEYPEFTADGIPFHPIATGFVDRQLD